MGIFNLPKPGNKFRLDDTYGSFLNRLKDITRQTSLRNLQDNIPAIMSTVKIYEKYIQRGGLSFWQKRTILERIKKMDKNLTMDDLKEIKEILNYLGK